MKRAKMVVMLVIVLYLMIYQVEGRGAISGSGTANHIPKFTNPTNLGDSAIFEAGGNVVIGTTSPEGGYKLTLDGAGLCVKNASAGIRSNGRIRGGHFTASDSGGISVFAEATGLQSTGISAKGTNRGVEGTTTSSDGYAGYFVGGRNYFEGNVGIGTTRPATKLHVNGEIKITDGSQGIGKVLTSNADGLASWQLPSAGDSDWIIAGSDMYSDISGNVGIGTTSPDEKLEVAGTVRSNRLSTDSLSVMQSHDATGPGLEVSRGVAPPIAGWYSTQIDGASINAYFRSGSFSGAPLRLNDDTSANVLLAEGGGNVGIGTTSPARELTVKGNIQLLSRTTGDTVLELGEGLDYAEGFDVSDNKAISPGSVLIIDSDNPGKLALSINAYDSKVAGIATGAKGMGSGVRLGGEQFDYDVALAGRVYCNVDATEIGIEAGDLLTTSATPGYAMKAKDYMRAQGAILGKAMEKLGKGKKGQILVLVTLQ